MHRSRYTLFTIAALLVLVFSAMSAVPVLADDSTPPSAETSAESPPEEATPEEALPPIVTDSLPEEASPPAEADPQPEESAAPVEDVTADVLVALPEGTEIVVVDEVGETIPLATQEAADAIEFIDPVWCPVGVTPKTDGSGGCTTSYGSLQLLVDDLMAGTAGVVPGANGVIWIQAGGDLSTSPIVLDGTDVDLGTMENFALTLQGGWNGVHNSSLITGTSTISQSLSIINWNGDITLNNLIISGVSVGSATNSAALDIETTKKITLIDVDVTNNTGAGTVHGAYLDNDDGALASDVVITNSTFANNKDYGVWVISDGAITITNLVANTNSTGARLENDGATTAKPITISGNSNQAKFNGESGLFILSNGAVTINSITANNNAGWGVYIKNDAFAGGSAPVKLTGANTFNQNSNVGLQILSDGAVTINNATGNQNGSYGLWVNNSGSIAPQAVTLSVSGGNPDTNFNENWDGNVVILTKGAITITGLNANNSGNGDGVLLQNNFVGAVGGVTISGWGAVVGDNSGDGLTILSKGAITLTNLWTYGNGNDGAILNNTFGAGPIKIDGQTGHWGNGGDGLLVYSNGAITLNNVTAADNSGYGVLLDNCLWVTPGVCTIVTAQPITLSGNNNFQSNGNSGLDITSKGNITINNVNSNSNGGYGAFLDNAFAGSVGTISVKNTASFWPSFNWNWLDGLLITSNGNVTLMDMDVQGNGGVNFYNADNDIAIENDYGFGLYIDNASGTGNVTIGTSRKGWCNGMSWNFQSGLTVYSNGTVTLSNLCNDGNGGYTGTVTGFDSAYNAGFGAYIDNTSSITPKAVTLLGSNALNNNATGGLYIFSIGGITLNNMNAYDNGAFWGGDGIHLDNSGAATPQAVTLKGNNNLSGNWNNGLRVESKGAITINNLSSNYNGDGAELYNYFSGTSSPQNVTITGFGEFIWNYNNGLDIQTYGAITLNNITANENGWPSVGDTDNGFGAYLDNYRGDATIAKPVTINGENDFSANLDGGLEIHSLGAIKINNFSAHENGGFGAWLNNSNASTPAPVMLTAYAYTSNNGSYGLQVNSKGAITVNVVDMWAGQNAGDGWVLNNNYSGAVGGVTLTSSNQDGGFDFWNNGGNGLTVTSLGAIKVTGLDSTDNTGSGAVLDNAFVGSVGTVTLTTSTIGRNDFAANGSDGLVITSNRAITVNNLYSSDNDGAGVMLDNRFSGSGAPQNVVLSGFGEFYNNGNSGLVITSFGQITTNSLSAEDNGQNNFYNDANSLPIDPTTGWGVFLDNCGYEGDPTYDCVNAVTPKPIIMNGTNRFNGNFQDGLWATSLGAITVKQVQANWNWGTGAYLDNQWQGAVGGITLTTATAIDLNQFNGNGGWGLRAYSNGNITLNNLMANTNGLGGADIDTFGVSAPQKVTLAGRNQFNNNGNGGDGGDFGLQVYADGQITINNLTANGNDGFGAYLNNSDYAWSGTPGITLTGANTFSYNYDTGLYFESTGNVAMTKITADANGGSGVDGLTTGNIMLTCGNMTNNTLYGWQFSGLIITLKGVIVTGSGNNLLAGTVVSSKVCPLP